MDLDALVGIEEVGAIDGSYSGVADVKNWGLADTRALGKRQLHFIQIGAAREQLHFGELAIPFEQRPDAWIALRHRRILYQYPKERPAVG